MGNYRFRLSDMMPNAWLYKLRVMTRGSRNPTLSHTTKKAHPTRTGGSSMSKHFPPPQLPSKESCYQPGRASYYFPSRPEKLPSSPVHPRASDTLFPIESARKSDKKARRKQERPSAKLVSSSVSSGCSCRATVGSVWKTDTMPEFPPAPESPPYDGGGGDGDENDGLPCSEKPIIAEHYDLDSGAAWSRSCSCRFTSSATDIILDMGGKSSSITRKIEETDDLHSVPEFGLPPILTKPTKREAEPTKADDDASVGSREKHQHKSNPCPPPKKHKGTLRRLSPGIQGLRMPTSSPRLASKKIQAYRQKKAHGSTPRKFLKESFAVIKSSSDPQRDFRDSMVEMIVENNIRASRDLEELLACYLSLNSNEYHDVIVKVFEQIWFDLTNIRS